MKPETLCKHLRSKSMFIPALADKDQPEGSAPSLDCSHCWCNCTLTETGPDDKAVGPDRCRSSRECFET